MISKEKLTYLYQEKKFSSKEVALQLDCSESKVNYWLKKYAIPKRSISEAIYQKNNPEGDPFEFVCPRTREQFFLFGLGIGLYWGEGTKANKHAVRLGNTDPKLVKAFLRFLMEIYNIDRKKLRFGLQIFADIDKKDCLEYWRKHLKVDRNQFYEPIITPHRGVGNYRKKTAHGVLTVYFGNKKLRDLICNEIKKV